MDVRSKTNDDLHEVLLGARKPSIQSIEEDYQPMIMNYCNEPEVSKLVNN